MRIIQFCTNYYKGGGIQTHAIDLVNWLRAQGHEVAFAGEPIRAMIDTDAPDFIPLPMAKVSRNDGNVIFRTAALLHSAFKLRRAISRHPVDLIHTHETAPAMVARLAVLGKNIPVVMTFHGSAPDRIPSAARIGRYCADLVASPSRISLDALIANGVNSEKTMVLGLGIKPLPESSPDEIAALRADYLSDPDGAIVFSPSRLAPQKGIDIMIEVARRVTAKHPGTMFIVAGGGLLTGQVEDWARAAGVGDNMRFLGPIDTVPAHLRAADIFLLTSRWEALPISIVEAFRAGLPVIATDCGGVSELVDEQVGTLCPVEDVEALTQTVLDYLERPDLRARKGVAALERSRDDRFDPQAVHQQFARVYQALITR